MGYQVVITVKWESGHFFVPLNPGTDPWNPTSYTDEQLGAMAKAKLNNSYPIYKIEDMRVYDILEVD